MESWAFTALMDGTPSFVTKFDAVIDFCLEAWSDITSARAFTAVIFVLDSLIPLSLMSYQYMKDLSTVFSAGTNRDLPC